MWVGESSTTLRPVRAPGQPDGALSESVPGDALDAVLIPCGRPEPGGVRGLDRTRCRNRDRPNGSATLIENQIVNAVAARAETDPGPVVLADEDVREGRVERSERGVTPVPNPVGRQPRCRADRAHAVDHAIRDRNRGVSQVALEAKATVPSEGTHGKRALSGSVRLHADDHQQAAIRSGRHSRHRTIRLLGGIGPARLRGRWPPCDHGATTTVGHPHGSRPVPLQVLPPPQGHHRTWHGEQEEETTIRSKCEWLTRSYSWLSHTIRTGESDGGLGCPHESTTCIEQGEAPGTAIPYPD